MTKAPAEQLRVNGEPKRELSQITIIIAAEGLVYPSCIYKAIMFAAATVKFLSPV